ncbi:hypothetical protein M426DRAFT_14118 [Hypoxylon sp. CI-4A]|nr:hypothetical protein M426DRAFT_14118 [Hypoxylon sp. CI-4A]
MAEETYITTPDGVRLRYWQEGPVSGPNIVFVAGWVQTAAQFRKQVAHFKTRYRVTTYDHRGHGESDKPAFGYRIYHLAADLHALLARLDLRDVTLVGHSMGAAVMWAHWDIFAHERIARLVVADQARALTINPAWTEDERLDAGALNTADKWVEFANALRGPQWKEAWTGVASSFFSPARSDEDFRWSLAQQWKTPHHIAAELFGDHARSDWTDVFARIDVPTLVIGAEGSLMPPQGMRWIASHIPGAKFENFAKDEGGYHFMFWENPDKFNRVLEEFIVSS